MAGFYPDKPPLASDGKAFERLCIRLHRELIGLTLTYCESIDDQFNIGDTFEGYEFKLLNKSGDRIFIEIEERTGLDRPWVSSGIYARNIARYYVCGNNSTIWCFWRHHLAAFHRTRKPDEVWGGGGSLVRSEPFATATVKNFVLLREHAETFFRWRFERGDDDRWAVVWGPLTTMQQLGFHGAGPYPWLDRLVCKGGD